MNEVEAEDSGIVTEGGNPMLEPEAAPDPLAALPEKFKSLDDLVESYSNLESKIGAKEETFRDQFMKEMEEQAYANRPESVGDYVLPDSIDDEMATDNPLLQWWANQAFENGYSQDEFAEGIEMYVNALNADVPDYDAEVEKLGDQFFPEEMLGAVERMCETAEGIMVLEHVMDALKEGGPSNGAVEVSRETEADLRQMMLDPRYHDPARRDPTFVKQVDDGFKRMFSNG
jgi:hypothetical protein